MRVRHVLLVAAILAASVAIEHVARAADAVGAAPEANPVVPSGEAIINACGAKLPKMFAEFGAPKYMLAARGATPDDDDVLFEYGSYILRIHESTVTNCFFKQNWKGPIRGIKIGDSREAVAKVLGKPRHVITKEGVATAYGFELKSPQATLWTNFDNDGNVRRVEIGLPD